MSSGILKVAIVAAFIVSPAVTASGAWAQNTISQLKKDSEKKNPAAADASLARDEAKRAKKQAVKAQKAADAPEAKAAAKNAADAADVAAKAANAAAQEADGQQGGSPAR